MSIAVLLDDARRSYRQHGLIPETHVWMVLRKDGCHCCALTAAYLADRDPSLLVLPSAVKEWACSKYGLSLPEVHAFIHGFDGATSTPYAGPLRETWEAGHTLHKEFFACS